MLRLPESSTKARRSRSCSIASSWLVISSQIRTRRWGWNRRDRETRASSPPDNCMGKRSAQTSRMPSAAKTSGSGSIPLAKILRTGQRGPPQARVIAGRTAPGPGVLPLPVPPSFPPAECRRDRATADPQGPGPESSCLSPRPRQDRLTRLWRGQGRLRSGSADRRRHPNAIGLGLRGAFVDRTCE